MHTYIREVPVARLVDLVREVHLVKETAKCIESALTLKV